MIQMFLKLFLYSLIFNLSASANDCPSNYLQIPASAEYGTTHFCVAKYEAKKSKDLRAISVPEGRPWLNMTRAEAEKACNKNGPGFNLVSNIQWQVIARDIEKTPKNWSSNITGKDYLNSGHSFNNPEEILPAGTSDSNPCIHTTEKCNLIDWHQNRRTHFLSLGGIIWDLAGNAWEIVQGDIDRKVLSLLKLDSAPFGKNSRFEVLGNEKIIKTLGPKNEVQSWDQGYGFIFKFGDGPVVARGGNTDDLFMSGIYSAAVGGDINMAHHNGGFRCTYSPIKDQK